MIELFTDCPSMSSRILPKPTPETRHFWDGTRRHELLLQRCCKCTHVYFPPRPFCPACLAREVEIVPASGRATLYSYVISQRPAPGLDAPYSIAVVTLEEGPRMMTNVIGCAQTPESLVLDMPLTVDYLDIEQDITLPLFRPVSPSPQAPEVTP